MRAASQLRAASTRLARASPRRTLAALVSKPEETVVALTGSSGYIGSHIAEALLAANYTVHALVRDASNKAKTAHLSALGEKHPGTLILFDGGDLFEVIMGGR